MKLFVDMNLSPDWREVLRAQDTLSAQFRDLVLGSLRRFEGQLKSDAIVVVEEFRARARVLPLPRDET